jgi:hypothetical protein
MKTSVKKMKQDEWLQGMLNLQDSLNGTIRSMIVYRMTSGPWDNKDVNDGWRVLRGILDSKEKELKK